MCYIIVNLVEKTNLWFIQNIYQSTKFIDLLSVHHIEHLCPFAYWRYLIHWILCWCKGACMTNLTTFFTNGHQSFLLLYRVIIRGFHQCFWSSLLHSLDQFQPTTSNDAHILNISKGNKNIKKCNKLNFIHYIAVSSDMYHLDT